MLDTVCMYNLYRLFLSSKYNISNSGNVFLLRSAGVIIEGFPSTTDEAEFMATKGNVS